MNGMEQLHPVVNTVSGLMYTTIDTISVCIIIMLKYNIMATNKPVFK